MKKINLILVVLVLILTVPILSYAQNAQYETIKLGLFFGATAKSEVNIKSESGFVLGFEENGEFIEFSDLAEMELKVFVNENGFVEAENILVNDTENILALYPINGHLKVGETPYRGGVLFVLKDNKMTVINKASLEEYLYSVVGKEMSPSWNIEALKAQAILARTYAINSWNKFASYGFNLCTTQNSQVYMGISSETSTTIQAVDETAGKIVKYEGKSAQVFYSATSGGKTANVKYVWGSDFPYLTGVDDPYEDQNVASYANWKEVITKETISQKLKNVSVDIGEVLNMEVTGVSNGTVYEVKITGTNGEHLLKNEKTRTFFGLKSQYYTISNTSSKSVLDNWDIVWRLARGEPLNTTFFADEFIITGKGWGHRIGLSQFGAKGMAENGFLAEEIVSHYFPGTYIE